MPGAPALTEATYYILLSLYRPRHGYGIMQQTEEPKGVPEDAVVVYERHGWSHISEWIREMPIPKEKGERYCVFELTPESASNLIGLPTMMLVMMASEMDEFKGGVTCSSKASKDGQNHFTLLYKKA